MYTVNGQEIESFMAAIAVAKKTGAEVFEKSSGVRRWAPAPKVSAKRMRQYTEQKAAFDAQAGLGMIPTYVAKGGAKLERANDAT